MKMFLYKVKDDTGRILWGVMEANDEKDIKNFFRTSSVYFVSAIPYNTQEFKKIKLKLDDLLMFTRRLSYLIDAGIPILQGLDILWKQSEQKDVQIIVSHIRSRLQEGGTLQEAFNDFPKVFPSMYLALIGVAEVGAGLVIILKKLCQYLEDQKEFVSRVNRATMYPGFVFCFAIVVVIALFAFVVPTFQKVLSRLSGDIPLITQVLFSFSNTLRNPYFLLFILLTVVAAVVAWKYLHKLKSVGYWIDSMKLRAPLMKNVLYPLLVGRFTRSLGLLVGCGVPLLQSIKVAKATVDNVCIENAVEEIHTHILEGGTMNEGFKQTKMFPVIVTEMIAIGEISGKLQFMLETLSAHLEEEADYALAKFLTYLEPAMIVGVGGIVLLVLLGVYLPILTIQDALRTM